jgi:transcriptional regulator GlxA family with amidase domain
MSDDDVRVEAQPTHLVLVTVFPGVDSFEVAAAAEVFMMANHLLAPERERYEIRFIGPTRNIVRAGSGLALQADLSFDELEVRPDTVVVAGRVDVGRDGPAAVVDREVVSWLATTGRQARRIAAVCAGGHLAAAASLLDGHRVTTHWATAESLAKEFPNVEVDPDPVFVRSGRVWTSAGITASVDMALAMVAEDHGNEVARRVGERMVIYVQRPSGQSQISVPLAAGPGGRDDIAELRRWIGENLAANLSVGALADRLCVSPRHLARVFRAEFGTTPGDYVEGLRLEQARRLLERTRKAPAVIAAECGFGSVETMHRVFRARTGGTPQEYRRRFTRVD